MYRVIRVYTNIAEMHTPDGWKKYRVLGSSDADMYALNYTEYAEDGRVVATGTEDFSIPRFKTLKSGGYTVTKDSGNRTESGRVVWDIVKRTAIYVTPSDYALGIKLWKKQFDGYKITCDWTAGGVIDL